MVFVTNDTCIMYCASKDNVSLKGASNCVESMFVLCENVFYWRVCVRESMWYITSCIN